jgi:alkylmercury lyase
LTTTPERDLDKLAASIVDVSRVSTRLSSGSRWNCTGDWLRGGRSRASLASRLEIPVETVKHVLDGWPGVYSDVEQRIVGYWGLSIPTAYRSPHTLKTNGRTLSAWCAWDTLFLPQLVGQPAEVESVSPKSGTVRFTLTPQQLQRVEAVSAQMSLVVPDAQRMQEDVLTSFCHFVHFFPSRQAAESWTAKHAGSFTLSIHEAHVLARLKNEMQYGGLLK